MPEVICAFAVLSPIGMFLVLLGVAASKPSVLVWLGVCLSAIAVFLAVVWCINVPT